MANVLYFVELGPLLSDEVVKPPSTTSVTLTLLASISAGTQNNAYSSSLTPMP